MIIREPLRRRLRQVAHWSDRSDATYVERAVETSSGGGSGGVARMRADVLNHHGVCACRGTSFGSSDRCKAAEPESELAAGGVSDEIDAPQVEARAREGSVRVGSDSIERGEHIEARVRPATSIRRDARLVLLHTAVLDIESGACGEGSEQGGGVERLREVPVLLPETTMDVDDERAATLALFRQPQPHKVRNARAPERLIGKRDLAWRADHALLIVSCAAAEQAREEGNEHSREVRPLQRDHAWRR